MDAIEAGEHVEFLYRTYNSSIQDYLGRLCRNSHLAEDLSSETFERALRALLREGFEAHENPTAWLRAIARNLLTDHYRKAANKRESPGTIYPDDPEPHGPADMKVLADEELLATHKMLEALTPGQRDVVVLRTLHGYSTAETAQLMGRTQQAVRSLRHKAMKRLADAHVHLTVTVLPASALTDEEVAS